MNKRITSNISMWGKKVQNFIILKLNLWGYHVFRNLSEEDLIVKLMIFLITIVTHFVYSRLTNGSTILHSKLMKIHFIMELITPLGSNSILSTQNKSQQSPSFKGHHFTPKFVNFMAQLRMTYLIGNLKWQFLIAAIKSLICLTLMTTNKMKKRKVKQRKMIHKTRKLKYQKKNQISLKKVVTFIHLVKMNVKVRKNLKVHLMLNHLTIQNYAVWLTGRMLN